MEQEFSYNDEDLIRVNECSTVYKENEDTIIKIFTDEFLESEEEKGLTTEKKLKDASNIKNMPELIKPNKILYNKQGKFIGYKMPRVRGMNLAYYRNNVLAKDKNILKTVANDIKKLEQIIKQAHKNGIVIPDLVNEGNIYFTKEGIKLIDYDGMQVKDNKTDSISRALGDESYLYNSKYIIDGDYSSFPEYTEELDKLSLLELYFLFIFRINTVNSLELRYSCDELINLLGLEHDPLATNIENIFNNDVPNTYLKESVKRISEEYSLEIDPIFGRRKLVRK